MSKINFNTENPEIEITRAIGKKSEGKITLNTEGGSIEVDLGFASVGATTDYGGAISVGLLGQEITWGREGGTVHIGIGGFAVDVEARDCIVTEIKSIFGIIVAQRSYPDPGCKLPEPPEPPQPDLPPVPPQGLEIPDGPQKIYMVLEGQKQEYSYTSWFDGYRKQTHNSQGSSIVATTINKEGSPVTSIRDLSFHTIDEGYTTFVDTTGTNSVVSETYIKNAYRSLPGLTVTPSGYGVSNQVLDQERQDQISFTRISKISTVNGSASDISRIVAVPGAWVVYGTATNCKSWHRAYTNYHKSQITNNGSTNARTVTYNWKVSAIIPEGFIKTSKPFLPTGNKPPMQNCCEEVLDMLKDIKEAYAVDRILKDKFPISNIFMAPGCDPASQTIAKNFYEILQCLFRTLAHGLIFEPSVNIKDADAAKAGDQEFKAKYLNATGWASAVAEALLEVKDDGNVSTNMDIRNAFAVTQTMVGLSDAIYRLNALIDSIGVEVIPRIETVDTPYNLQIQIGKGFGEGNERQIDLNQDEATEKLLPELLKVKTNKIKTVETHPRSRSIKDILESIESNLPTINNG